MLGEAVYQQLLQLSPSVLNFEKVFTLHEQYLYGSKRLGVRRPKLQLPTAPHLPEVCALELLQVPLLPVKRANCFRCRESETIQKRTECLAFPQRLTAAGCAKSKIQFGNQKSEINQVLDRKTGVKASPTATTYAWFKADVSTAQDYYPFGSLMPGRTYVAPAGAGYRFGFNGQQRDDEIKGPGNSLDFGARMYDSRLGRFLARDKFENRLPFVSPYHGNGNNPIFYIDENGDYFTGSTEYVKQVYAILSELVKNDPYNESAKAFKSALEKMDNSDIEFHIATESHSLNEVGGRGGNATFDFENNRVTLTVFQFDLNDGDHPQTFASRMAHELEHGRQFMEGELDFAKAYNEKGKIIDVGGPNYDTYDESRAVDVGAMVHNATSHFDKKMTPQRIENQKKSYHGGNLPTGDFFPNPDQTDHIKKNISKPIIAYQSIYNHEPNGDGTQERILSKP